MFRQMVLQNKLKVYIYVFEIILLKINVMDILYFACLVSLRLQIK